MWLEIPPYIHSGGFGMSRITIENCGEVGLWIYFDGQVIDLIHLSDLQKTMGLKQKTIDAIEQVYDDIIGEEE